MDSLTQVREHCPPPKYFIRWMIRRDMPEVIQNEADAHGERGWNNGEFLSHLRKRNIIGLVAEVGEVVVGHIVYRLESNSLSILNFAVAPAWQPRGVGREMIAKMIAKILHSHERDRLTVLLRESNLGELLLFKEMGFVAEAVLLNEFVSLDWDHEDGILMAYTLAPF